MKAKIESLLREHLELAQKIQAYADQIELVAKEIQDCFHRGNKIIFLGNGGSAADALHLTAEYVSKFLRQRKSLPALALTANIAEVTSIANDWNFEYVFARQLESLANNGDIVICLSTSGESRNVIAAAQYCRDRGTKTISFTGNKKNTVAAVSDIAVLLPSANTAKIQEAYLLLNHIICEVVEESLAQV